MTSGNRTENFDPGRLRRVARVRVGVVGAPADDWKSGTRVSVGTAVDNDLVLEDAHVSRYHAEFRAGDKGVRLVDLGSRNGTWISGMRVGEATLGPGVVVRMGDMLLEVHAFEGETEMDAGEEVDAIIGVSDAISEVRRTIRTIANTQASVLVQGETGTGKELVAQAIHRGSERRDGPFVVVDCGSMPTTLVASELFGQEKAAFTGAEERRIGAFEQAHGGTIFLDEIGELPIEIQPALLGVLERRRFRRVGGRDEVEVDVRVVSATHRDLRHQVNEGGFRADLYYRLAVTRILIPPLRERLDDLDALVKNFLVQLGADPEAFGEAALATLRQYSFAGNVRELRNIVEATLALGSLQLQDTAARSTAPEAPPPIASIIPYRNARADALARFEKAYLADMYERWKGNAAQAAREAGIDRTYMLKLFKRHGMK